MINADAEIALDYLLSPEFELINSAGKPLTGGYIEVYIHGTRNKYYCYEDWNGTLHPFQIPLDSIGSNVILASPENAYDVYVYNKFGSLIMSRYNVHCQGGNGGSSTYVGDKLFYGQYRASNVTTIANLSRNKGNINLSSNGYLQLKNGMSYHITVRGAFQVDDVTNTETTLNYIEYTSVNPIKIDIDETKEGPQYFELSYDIYRLPDDMDYQVAFAQSNGMVTELLVEVHSLSNLATSSAGGDQEYESGWGIDITNNVISVDPSILDDYVTEEELLEIVTGITGIIPEDVATHTEVYEATVTAIEYVTGMIPQSQIQSDWNETNESSPAYIQNKPDLHIYTTHDEVYESSVSSIQLVTGLIPDVSDFATHTEIYDSSVTAIQLVTGLIPDVSDFTTHDEVYEAVVTGVQLATSMIPEQLEAGQYISIEDNTINVTGLQPEGDYATNTEVSEAIVTAIETVTALIPAAQVQSDWDEEDTTDPAYIQNKPEEKFLVAGDGINITESATGVVISAAVTGIEGYVTEEEFIEVVSAVTGSGDFGQFYCASGIGACEMAKVRGTIDVTNDGKIVLEQGKSYHVTVRGGYDNTELANVDTTIGLIEYISNRTIQVNVDRSVTGIKYFEISYDLYNLGADTNYYVFFTGVNGYGSIKELFIEIHTLGGAGSGSGSGSGAEYTPGYGINILNNIISLDTSVLPDPQVQSDWAETDNTDVSYIKNKPTELNLVEGPGIHIVQDNTDIIISAVASGYATEAEVYNAVVTGIQTVTSLIPDVSDMATQTWVNNQGFLTSVPDTYATDTEVYDATVTAIQIATAAIPDTSDMATKTWVVNQGYLTEVPSTYATDTEVSQAIASSISDFVTEPEVTALIPESEEVEFEELDITQFAQTSAIPVVTGFATKSELSDVEATIPTIQLNGNDQVTAINNHEIAGTGGGGTTYTAGDHIGIVNDEISVTGITELVAGNAITITTSGVSAIISSTGEAQVQSDWNVTDSSSKAYIKNKPTIPSAQVQSNWNETNTSSKAYIQNKPTIHNYTGASGVAINNDTITLDNPIGLVAGDNIEITVTGVSAIISTQGGGGGTTYTAGQYISIDSNDVITVTGLDPLPNSEEVDFEELDLANYALASAIPTVQLNNNDQVTAINNHPIAAGGGGSTYSAGNGIDITNDVISIDNTVALKTDIPVVTGFATKNELETVSGMIPDEEEVEFEELDLSNYAMASAIPTLNSLNTAGITDIQVVQALPVSPVSSVLYLIPEV